MTAHISITAVKVKAQPSGNPPKYTGILRSTPRLVQISKRGQKERREPIRVNWNASRLNLGNKLHFEKAVSLNGSSQHSLRVYLLEFQYPYSFVDVD